MVKTPPDNSEDAGSIPGEGNGNPIPVFLPETSHAQRILAGYRGHKESNTTGHDPQSNLHATNPGSNTYLRENAPKGRGPLGALGKSEGGPGERSLQLSAGPRSTLSPSPVAWGSG